MKTFLMCLDTLLFIIIIEATSTRGVIDCQVRGTVAENASSGFLLNQFNGGFVVPRFVRNTIAEVDITPQIYLQTWSFVPSQGPYYELTTEINGQWVYLGIDVQGFLRLIPCSSNGNHFVQYVCRPCIGRCPNYATAIWKPSCNGTMKAELNNKTLVLYFDSANVAQYTFAKEKPLRTVLLLPVFIPINPLAFKNTKPTSRTHFLLKPLSFVVDLIDLIMKITSYPTNEPSRCLEGLEPKQQGNQTPNGCGTDKGVGQYVPELFFNRCCKDHDNCWGNCKRGFSECNVDFSRCMHQTCADLFLPRCDLEKCDLVKYNRTNEEAEDLRANNPETFVFCHGAAWLYYQAVSTNKGVDVFNDATTGACSCETPVTNSSTATTSATSLTCNSKNFAASSIFGMQPPM